MKARLDVCTHTLCSVWALPYSTCLQLCRSPQSRSCHSESVTTFTCGDPDRLYKKETTACIERRVCYGFTRDSTLKSCFDSWLCWWLCVSVLIIQMWKFGWWAPCVTLRVCHCLYCLNFPSLLFCFSLLGRISRTADMPRKIIHKSSGREDSFNDMSWRELSIFQEMMTFFFHKKSDARSQDMKTFLFRRNEC